MLDISFLLKGLLIGFAVAAAVGPIAILCIQRTIAHGFMAGLLVGLGAAVADGCYGAIAGAGLVSLSSLLLQYKNIISMLGALFLFWLAIKTIASYKNITLYSTKIKRASAWRIFVSSFFLTITNPMTILFFTALFTSVGLLNLSATHAGAISIILGVFLGSAIWWVVLSGGVINIVRGKLSGRVLAAINFASGLTLLGFASYAFIHTVTLS